METQFEKIGARVKLREDNKSNVIDVLRDKKGEFFDIKGNFKVINISKKDKHLLLMSNNKKGEKDHYLCGFDERGWFVAGVPTNSPVGTVEQAKRALKPEEVIQSQVNKRVKSGKINKRKNAGFKRQGEWFFIPDLNISPDPMKIISKEPLVRGDRSKPHIVDELYRTGGVSVRANSRHPNGITQEEYEALLRSDPKSVNWHWEFFVRDADVFVRGKVRHPDHKTIDLKGWHRVFMNTESRSRAMSNIAFLD